MSSQSSPTEWTSFLQDRLETLTVGHEPDPKHRPSHDVSRHHHHHHHHHHQHHHPHHSHHHHHDDTLLIPAAAAVTATTGRPAPPPAPTSSFPSSSSSSDQIPPPSASPSSSSSSSPPCPSSNLPTSFHAFPRLPVEIRLAIWHHALPSTPPRPPLQLAIRDPRPDDTVWRLELPTTTPRATAAAALAEATLPARNLLAATREARTELLTRRLPHTLELAGGGLLRFDAADDIICLTELGQSALGLIWQATAGVWRMPFAPPDLSGVVTLGLDVAVFGDGGFESPLSSLAWLVLLRGFIARLPRLERVLVVDASPPVGDELAWERMEGLPSVGGGGGGGGGAALAALWSRWRVVVLDNNDGDGDGDGDGTGDSAANDAANDAAATVTAAAESSTRIVNWYRDGPNGADRPGTIDVALRLWELKRCLLPTRNAVALGEDGWDRLAALDIRGWRNGKFVECDPDLAKRKFVLYGD